MNATTYRRPRLRPHVWGLSGSWFAICPWNDYGEFWIQLPFVYLGGSLDRIELGLGRGKFYVTFTIQWRWS